jgi:lipoprotein-releasing system ATP-binding protein
MRLLEPSYDNGLPVEARPLLTAVNLHKTYHKDAVKVPVLRGLDLEVHPGEFLSVVGASGSGKSTLLHLLGTIDRPDQGEIRLDNRRIDNLSTEQRDRLRNRTFGFIFQFYHLLPELNTLENVLVPSMIAHSVCDWLGHRRILRQRGTKLLERVGLGHRLRHRPRELSGGEMQRAAIARALINQPRILLADEPTGNLDAATGGEIVHLLRDLNQREGLTIIMVTHNLDIVATTDRVVRLVAGRVEGAPPAAGDLELHSVSGTAGANPANRVAS